MEVVVWGTNYTGAHFRGLDDKFDDRTVMIRLVGEQSDIVKLIRDNFSYGGTGVHGLAALCDDLRTGREMQWEGCGGVARIWADGNVVFEDPDAAAMELTASAPWVDLGTVVVTGRYQENVVNKLVRQRG